MNITNGVFIDAIFAAVACLGFANANVSPKRTLLVCAVLGGLGHAVRFLFWNMEFLGIATASLIASFTIGLFAVFFASRLRTPIEIIAFPALLPMVPGVYAYKSILAIFSFLKSGNDETKMHHLIEFFNNFFITVSVAVSLAVGVSMVLLLFFEKSFTMTRHTRLSQKYNDVLNQEDDNENMS